MITRIGASKRVYFIDGPDRGADDPVRTLAGPPDTAGHRRGGHAHRRATQFRGAHLHRSGR